MEADGFQEEEDEEMAETGVDSQVRIEPPSLLPPPRLRSHNVKFSRFTLYGVPAPDRIVLREPQFRIIRRPNLNCIEQPMIYLMNLLSNACSSSRHSTQMGFSNFRLVRMAFGFVCSSSL